MSKSHVLFHLREAAEELARTIAEVEAHSAIEVGDFSVAMQHLYHHLNTAWNTRRVAADQVEVASDEDFNSWGSYPADLPPMQL